MIAEILPPEVAAVEAFEDVPGAMLFPEEEAVIARAVEKRRREFTTARVCARAALAQLGLPPVPILPGLHGAPQWPAGVVGSITHCAGYRASAVARTEDMLALGVDAEPNDALPDGVLDLIALPEERARLNVRDVVTSAVCWDRLMFCAKEAVYKTWFPLTGRWLGYEEAAITIDPLGTFAARLLVPGVAAHDGGRLTGFAGRWVVRHGLIAAVIAIPR